MSTTKLKTPPTGANGATASNEPRNYRTNPETEAKIDDWIKEYPKDWKYITDMPVDRLRRTLVLNDIRKTEARERIGEETLKAVNNDPKRKQSYDVLTEGMSADERDDFIIKTERDKWLRKQQAQSQTQTTTKKEAVGIGV